MTQISDRISSLSPQQRDLLLRKLAARRGEQPAPGPALPRLVPRPEERYLPFPLSDVQEALWAGRSGLFDLGTIGANAYFEMRFKGFSEERVAPFNAALCRCIDRHDMLRAIILPDGRQQILEWVPTFSPEVVDLRGLGDDEAERSLEAIRQRLRRRKAPVDRWPLFDIVLVLLGDGQARFMARFELLILDGIARFTLYQELFQLLHDPGIELAPIDCSFRDYVLTWREFQNSEVYQRSLEHWRRRLPAFPPPPELPLAGPVEPRTPSVFVYFILRALEPAEWERLKELAARASLTPSLVATAAYLDTLSAWSRSPHFSLALEGAFNPPIHPHVGRILGNFHNLVLLAAEGWSGTFEERGKALKRQVAETLEHHWVSGFKVLRELNRARGGSSRAGAPIFFNSLLEYSHASYDVFQLDSRVEGPERSYVDAGAYPPQLHLINSVIDGGGSLLTRWKWAEAVFPEEMVRDMAEAYCRHLQHLAAGEESWREPWPDTRRRLLPPAQRERRRKGNSTAGPIPEETLDALFERQLAERRDRTAVVDDRGSASYGELDAQANRIARALRQRAVRPRSIVGVALPPGWRWAAAALGVMRAGAVVLPIDPEAPESVWRRILESGDVSLIVTESRVSAQLPAPPGPDRLSLEDPEIAAASPERVPPSVGPGDLAYVGFTAGTTGEPKGALLEHRALANTLLALNERLEVLGEDRLLTLSAADSDLLLYEVLGTLAAGGTVVVSGSAEPAVWARLLERERITVWSSSPARLERLLAHLERSGTPVAAPLRLALLARDRTPASLPGRLRRQFGNARVAALSGAVEASIASAVSEVEDAGPEPRDIPYGRPLRNQRIHVLDELLEERPDRVPGEVWIAGLGLARGYWKDEPATRSGFCVHPRTGERLFRTGDLGRVLPGGEIELLGRSAEGPLYVLGYPVEPREIEAALERHPGVRAAVVASRRTDGGETSLVAHGLVREEAAPSIAELQAFLEERLAFYRIPRAWSVRTEWPLTREGRVARRELAPPERGRKGSGASAASQGALERELADLWREVLDRGTVGIDESFFELGGDSLSLVRMMAAVEERFGRDLPLFRFFEQPTVEHLAGMVATARQRRVDRVSLANESNKGETS